MSTRKTFSLASLTAIPRLHHLARINTALACAVDEHQSRNIKRQSTISSVPGSTAKTTGMAVLMLRFFALSLLALRRARCQDDAATTAAVQARMQATQEARGVAWVCLVGLGSWHILSYSALRCSAEGPDPEAWVSSPCCRLLGLYLPVRLARCAATMAAGGCG